MPSNGMQGPGSELLVEFLKRAMQHKPDIWKKLEEMYEMYMKATPTDQWSVQVTLWALFTIWAPEAMYEKVKQSHKELEGEEKKKFEMFVGTVCDGFLISPEYKGGDTTKVTYKICCELYSHCSFFKQPMIFILGAAAGGLLIFIISMTLVGCCLLKKKKGGGGGGSASPKTGKTAKSMKKTSKNKKK